jgi:hypothetical protein
MNTKEYAISLINTLSDEQVSKIVELILVFQQRDSEKKIQDFQERNFDAMGILHEYANPEMIPFEKGAWERAVIDEYAETHNT